ncbi:hypothetical protein [Gracilimonas mengyeensis]|uniref:Uncharacterized protein n=1 Tax=Gracilimonas mengyeensis TaxID=1302730 RepID=A0A521E8H3_9BACT|nr:hypothetical protein [Gracilimonas mengyeensis]SMO80233.1 hypothetical protein SAMN06265219_11116 [Gracilimonas mengyeensis]
MAEAKLSKLEKRKKELEDELTRLQEGIDDSIDDVKEGVSSSLDPKNIIRKYPLPVVGASIIAGFLLGSKRKGGYSSSNTTAYRGESSDSALSKEIKRILTRKGLSMLMDFLDDKIHELKQRERPE